MGTWTCNEPTTYTRHSVEWAVANGILEETKKHDLRLHTPCTKQEVLAYLYLIFKTFTKDKE